MKIISFNKELKKGQAGENRFMEYLNRANCEFRDVRFDKEFQKKGIDFIFKDTSFEIKTSGTLNKSGYVYIELVGFKVVPGGYKKIPGWWQTIEADNIVFIDNKEWIGYRVRIPELKAFLLVNHYPTYQKEFEDGQETIKWDLLVIPLCELIKAGLVYEFKL